MIIYVLTLLIYLGPEKGQVVLSQPFVSKEKCVRAVKYATKDLGNKGKVTFVDCARREVL